MFLFNFDFKKLLTTNVFIDDRIKIVETYELNGKTFVLDGKTKQLLGFGGERRDEVIAKVLLKNRR